jgi:replication factor A1
LAEGLAFKVSSTTVITVENTETRLIAVLKMASNAQVAAARIDQGSLAAIFDDTPGRVQQPLVQCVQVKPIAAQAGAPERFRVVFSDIQNYVQTMLATGANSQVTEGGLRRGCFVRLKAYQANAVKGKK